MNIITIVTNKIIDAISKSNRLSKWLWSIYNMSDTYIYPVKCYFFPNHNLVRKSIPNEWIDSTELIRLINFSIVTEFVEKEMDAND